MSLIRAARPPDLPDVLRLIRELAVYEREPDAVIATLSDLSASMFPADRDPLVHCHLAEADRKVVGIAVWYATFSTWEGRHGLYLEDLFVDPDHRGGGIGRALVAELAAEAVRRGFPRLEWSVLHWNDSAREFYRSLGADPMPDWIPYRISGRALRELASREPASGTHAATT